MKKAVFLALALVVCLSLCACSAQLLTLTEPSGATTSTQPKPTTPTTQPTQIEDNTIQYISNRRVQYNESTEEYIVFFGLEDEQREYTHSSGTAEITIQDDNGEVIYQKDIPFDESDFTSWTNTSS